MTNELLTAATQLLEARAVMQLTEDEWEALAQAVKDETGEYIQWRTDDELNTEWYHSHLGRLYQRADERHEH